MNRRMFRAAFAGSFVVSLWLCAVAAGVADPAPSSADALWQEGLARVAQGRFPEALQTIDELVNAGPAIESDAAREKAMTVRGWLAEFEAQQDMRRSMTRADYEKYVTWVEEHVKKEQWGKAVDDLFRAYLSCEDTKAFQNEPWVLNTTERAAANARALCEKGEWLDAARIFGELVEVFEPDNAEYRKWKRKCRTHILLEEIYKPENDWQDGVRDIDPDMARTALQLVERRYVTDPDMAAVTLGGLQRLVLMAKTTKLAEVFPSMKDDVLVDEFTRRLTARTKQIEDDDHLSLRDAIRLFNRALEINDESLRYPEEVAVAEFMEGALEPLDEFSSMIWPAEVEQFRKDTMGEFSGVGVQITLADGQLKVISPLEDTPAYNAGIQPGDVITKVNGESTMGISIDQAVRRITGPAGTKVVLTIRRLGEEEEIDVPVIRDRITIHTIKGLRRVEGEDWDYWADPEMKIAYVRVTGFMENTVDELADVLASLEHEGMRGLIIDLRFNPGGLLKSAVDMCDLLLPPGRRIVSTKGRESKESEQSASRNRGFSDVPLVILVNDISASASEIVSGAVQDHHRGLILGDRTFGKGLVQNLEALNASGSAYIKLTTAKYYLPNGRCIQKEPSATVWGVDPDVPLKLVPKEMRKVLELRRKFDVLKGKNQDALPDLTELEGTPESQSEPDAESSDTNDAGRGESKKDDGEEGDAEDDEPEDENNRPDIDPQLDAALMVLRIRLLADRPWPIETEPVTAQAAAPKDLPGR
jgi:carboxyl-terminal processing protease